MLRQAHPSVNDKRASRVNEAKNVAPLCSDWRSIHSPSTGGYLSNTRAGREVCGHLDAADPGEEVWPVRCDIMIASILVGTGQEL
jgi:hypothetical protein